MLTAPYKTEPHSAVRPLAFSEWLVGGAALAVLALAMLVTVAMPLLPVERQFMLFVNQFAAHSVIVDRAFVVLSERYIVSGIPLMACIWFVWFKSDDMAIRRMVLTGTLAAFCSAAGSRLLQIFMPNHPRPLYTEGLDLTRPFGVDPHILNDWSSFPSDHAAVYAGLALVVWRVSRPLGAVAIALAALLCFTRIYLGYHFATDIIGGAALGVLAVCVAGLSVFQRIGGWLTEFSVKRPDLFYPLAFIVTYGIATLFTEVRGIVSGLLHYA